MLLFYIYLLLFGDALSVEAASESIIFNFSNNN